MKALILSSSLKKANSFTLRIAKTFLKRVDCSEIEIVYLCEKKINYCNGCMSCFKTKNCIIDDDIADIKNQIIMSDLIIFSTPVYFFSVSSVMKTLLDRLVIWGYNYFKGKKAFVVTTADGGGVNPTIKYLNKFFGFSGFINKGWLYCFLPEFMNYKQENSRFQKQLKSVVNSFKKEKNIYRPSLDDYIFYNVRKRLISHGRKKYYIEYNDWKESGQLEMIYFKNDKVIIKNSFLKSILGRIISKFMIYETPYRLGN